MSLGMVTGKEMAEQADARYPFQCTSIHPAGFCGQKQGYQTYTMFPATLSGHHSSCAHKGVKTTWCCRQNSIEFIAPNTVSQGNIYGPHGQCTHGHAL
ncbi:hypothetical protein MJO28_008536 [Puccinia striiformis f. sp. tritici]|uniref:Uncharacterized protein n=2 Tax=Puccinia striiformis f. sp. tritici TaxID=168172 RepID=A0ACC0ECT0_9BASI|nr:hypothetical protein MJO28_008536 [Puccinia striiformis f. sp. tritici]KAI7952802.1 hypothetical protein MJO29_008433 [Puccinia striiformis f. sp. tritici]